MQADPNGKDRFALVSPAKRVKVSLVANKDNENMTHCWETSSNKATDGVQKAWNLAQETK